MFEIAVDVRAGANAAGAQPKLGAGDFTVSLDGHAVAVEEARPVAAGEWKILVYVDGLVAKHDELERAAAALEAAKERLASLGPVTILVADTLVEPWVEDTTDLDELQSAFAELGEATFEPLELPRRRLRRITPGAAARTDRTALLGQRSTGIARDRRRQRRAVGRRRQERRRRIERRRGGASRTPRVAARSRPRSHRWAG